MSQVRRRNFLIAAAGLAALSLPAYAQQSKRVRRIGYFTLSNAKTDAARLAPFREGMAAMGWVEGRDYVIDARYGNGVVQTYPGLADDLVAAQPDVLLAAADTPASLLGQRTKTMPIVMAAAQDPVGNRLVASLNRPAGNITGLTSLARELGGKRLQLLKEAFPRVAHVALLFEERSPSNILQKQDIEKAAASLKIRVTAIELRQVADIEPAFKRGAALGVQAYMVAQTPIVTTAIQATVDHASRVKVPTIFPRDDFVESGGLMSYSASQSESFRRAAGYVDKIFKGAKPGDLPIEQPTRFELVLNLKTAKAMGFKFPQSILVRADRVVE
jgi:putative ABC transport system substrate-binding protein